MTRSQTPHRTLSTNKSFFYRVFDPRVSTFHPDL
jgi:hypothetical protein